MIFVVVVNDIRFGLRWLQWYANILVARLKFKLWRRCAVQVFGRCSVHWRWIRVHLLHGTEWSGSSVRFRAAKVHRHRRWGGPRLHGNRWLAHLRYWRRWTGPSWLRVRALWYARTTHPCRCSEHRRHRRWSTRCSAERWTHRRTVRVVCVIRVIIIVSGCVEGCAWTGNNWRRWTGHPWQWWLIECRRNGRPIPTTRRLVLLARHLSL